MTSSARQKRTRSEFGTDAPLQHKKEVTPASRNPVMATIQVYQPLFNTAEDGMLRENGLPAELYEHEDLMLQRQTQEQVLVFTKA